jgi:lipid-A-disaccharide synthase
LKYFVLAGEASGDKQGALLCAAIRRVDPAAAIQGWGGEAMNEQGAKILKHYRELAFMGFVEVIKHLPTIFSNFRLAKSQIIQFRPDALILVDYPGFNLRMATWAHRQGIRVYYYISPQLWAWHTSRVKKVRKAVRRMFVILPFEKEFYARYGMEVTYIGHPLAMAMKDNTVYAHQPIEKQIALLPGSRAHEITRILPVMAGLAQRMPDYTFTVVAVPHIPLSLYHQWTHGISNMQIQVSEMTRVLGESKAAIVTSGTATLETALHGVPQVVVYKGSGLSFQIAKRLVKVPFISLVNLIAEKLLVPELIQKDCTPEKLQSALQEILDPERYQVIRDEYHRIGQLLLSGGGAETAARDIFTDVTHNDIQHGVL